MTLSIKGGGGIINEVPSVTNLRVTAFETKTIDIEYKVEDIELTICRHYLLLNGAKTEITKQVGYESSTNVFRYQITRLEMGRTYTIQIVASDGHDEGLSQAVQQATKNAIIYGVRVMENNSNPNSSVTYIEQAVGTNPANSRSLGGWENKWPFNKIRIVGLKNGKVIKEIKKENKTQYIDGSSVPTDVDVMIEIPKIYWDFKSISNGYELRISDERFNDTCDCLAHKVAGVEKSHIYVGAYLGSVISGSYLRSVSGQRPMTNAGLYHFRFYAQNKGGGYQEINFYTLTLIQILYLIAFKNLDSQSALGQGYTSKSNSSALDTGGTDTKGFVYGGSGDEQMCFLGIEDLWGNVAQLIDGIYYTNMHTFLANKDNKTFNDNHDGYVSVSEGYNSGYLTSVSHGNSSGFLPKKVDRGASNIHYCDWITLIDERFMRYGGSWNEGQECGVWNFVFLVAKNEYNANTGGRLCYLG